MCSLDPDKNSSEKHFRDVYFISTRATAAKSDSIPHVCVLVTWLSFIN